MPQITLSVSNVKIQDTYVYEGQASSNYGANATMSIGESASGTSRSLLQFDLGLIPNDVIINSATLNLYKTSTGVTKTINIHKLLASFSETAVNWSNQPQFDSTVYASTTTPDGAGFVSFDIKTLVQEWVNGISPNFGMILRAVDEDVPNSKQADIATKENTNTCHRRDIIDPGSPERK